MRAWDINQSPRLYNVILRGPNTEADEKSAYNNVQVGEGPNIEKLDPQFLQSEFLKEICHKSMRH
ncbi:hypothetical protein SAB2311c [Staphylococcus aureus RF122]|nr:hypothetical protein SAB2311c [Staphylococcus aureus RF122]